MNKIALLLLSVALAGCGGGIRMPDASPPPPVAPLAAANPTAVMPAPGARVRAVIAARAQARGTRVAQNTPAGVVLERELTESTPAVVEQCGDHTAGRIVRIVLSTQDVGGQTRVEERRFIVDGSKSCQLRLTPAEVEQANQGLEDIAKQASGRAA